VRIRIALTTALAVIAGLTTGIFTLGTRQAASAQGTTHAHKHVAYAKLSHSALAGFAIPATVPVVTTTTTTTAPPLPPPPTTTTTTTTTTPTPPAVAPAVTASVDDANSVATADWMCIRVHESGDRYNSLSAPSGAYAFDQHVALIRAFRLAVPAPASVQDQVALELYARYGFHPWSSRFACGL